MPFSEASYFGCVITETVEPDTFAKAAKLLYYNWEVHVCGQSHRDHFYH
jgi:hypothetical protein